MTSPRKIDITKYDTVSEVARMVDSHVSTFSRAIDRGMVGKPVVLQSGTRLIEIAAAKRWAKNRNAKRSVSG